MRHTTVLVALVILCSCARSSPQELRRVGSAVLTIPEEEVEPGSATWVVCAYGDHQCPRNRSTPVGEAPRGAYADDDLDVMMAPDIVEAMLWSVPNSPRRLGRIQGERLR